MEASRGGRTCAAKYAGAGPCVGTALLRCGSCGAPNYCSRAHQMAHWREHKDECNRMAEQMMRAYTVHDFPFSFTEETVQGVEGGVLTLCSFLEDRDLHLQGLWKAECGCDGSKQSSEPGLGVPDPYKVNEGPFLDWQSYYKWRDLPLESPVALLLHWPLTLYDAFSRISMRSPTLRADVEEGCCVHYLGPEREVNMLQVFAELLAFFPSRHLHIDMIGPGVPSVRDGELLDLREYPKCSDEDCLCKTSFGSESRRCSRVTVKLWRGLYHDRYSDMESSPQFIFAPNAGLAAFSSWQPTLKLISRSGIPAIFSDYCEEAAELALRSISSACTAPVSHSVQLNPFRQPLCPRERLMNLPTYSNCFIFGIN
ncbi:hypothetical protein R1flu_001357 [Riccia fluitans]|uniref:MYND-type domain-containing protein n=1 Tax=Riccia fluitans TaxID=41844 RepID=A0ABD1Y6A6_9MARC